VDLASVVRFISTFERGEPELTGRSQVERDLYSRDPKLAHEWALTIVDDAVNRKIENYCYPIVRGAPGSYELSWGFKSLLGAMWLQMMFLMRADRRCRYCGRPIDPGRRSHAEFCDNGGKCRAKYAYHSGGQEEAKQQQRRRGASDAAS
jgi:hypothetical protein